MKHPGKILSVLLAVILILPGIPRFISEDANFDTRISLEDVIINMRNISAISENDSGRNIDLNESVANAISTIQAAAGLRTVLKQADHKAACSGTGPFDFIGLVSADNILPFFPDRNAFENVGSDIFKSFDPVPDTPPPKV